MDYLVTVVMDKGDGRWPEWYNFVWNRTRAIRKVHGAFHNIEIALCVCVVGARLSIPLRDITLQHLCTPECVELVEKCARWVSFSPLTLTLLCILIHCELPTLLLEGSTSCVPICCVKRI